MKNLWKEVYAALEIKHIAFKMYMKNNHEIFEFFNNKIELAEEEILVNEVSYKSIQDVVSFIQNY